MEKDIYFDNAATTFPKSEIVYRAMDQANRQLAVNAGRGSYALAKKAADLIEETKERIKILANAEDTAEVVLTASATLACNQVFGGMEWKKEDVVYVSPYEHNAVMRVLHNLQKKHGFEMEELGIDRGTLELDLARIRFQFSRKKPSLVAMTHVSNVLGYLLPVEAVAGMASEYGAAVVIDGAQAFGVVPLDLKRLAADFYIFAGHKTLYGPFGTGGFIHCRGRSLAPFLAGGTGRDSLNLEMDMSVPEGLEPGSYNIVSIAGLFASLKEIQGLVADTENPAFFWEQERELSKRLIEAISGIKGVTCYLPAERGAHAGIISFNIAGYQAADVGMILDQDYHIAVRTGYQCAPFIHRYLGAAEYAGVVRASLGRFTTKEEIDALADAVREIAKE